MATLILETLEAAFESGEIDGRDSHDSSQVEKINWLLSIVWEHPGISSFQLSAETQLNRSTILTYCQWLVQKDLVKVSHKTQGGVCYYYPP